MGSVLSVLSCIRHVIFSNTSGTPMEAVPISYVRAEDYSISGSLRDGVHDKWNKALHSMIFLDLNTRRIMWPLIQRRMDRMEASMKYTNCNLDHLKMKYAGWDDRKIFQIHDLFQAFEVDGDGLIEIAEMSVGLDNLGDKTSMNDRIPQLCSGDEDGTGSIDFEEFVQILYQQQEVLHSETPLSKTFINVNNDVMFIRWMSTVQQIRAGFF
ncbi:caltractin-like [Folsomia candida]|uniref:Caltractin n=1 Tax=Folsomia candida TaxID=158441 RepID=A0A226EFF9_FOLCA|nr:caltractin-like [Folsomia candida]OXA56139.1 Caltractin [Folsomia candida]